MLARTLELAPAKRAALERVRDRDRRAYLRARAGALLLIADGLSLREVARGRLPRPRQPKTVGRWLAAYLAGGVAGLVQRARGHRGFSPCAGRGGGGGSAPVA